MSESMKNVEKEKIVIGCCLNDSTCVKTAISLGLQAKCFADPICKTVFATMENMIREYVGIDIMTVSARLKNYFDFLADCSNQAASFSVLFEANAMDLVKLSAVREAFDKITKLGLAMQDKPLDIANHMRTIEAAAKKFTQTVTGHGMGTAEEAIKAYVDMISSDEKVEFFPLLRGLRKPIFHRGESIVLAADTCVGKTALAAGAVNMMLDHGLSVLYCCCESSMAEILGRIVAARCDIDHKRFLNRIATQSEWEMHNKALQELKSYNKTLAFHCLGDGVKLTPSAIEASMKQSSEKAGRVDVVVIDFLQQFHDDYVRPGTSKNDEMQAVMQKLHDMFHANGTSGLILAQYHRSGQVEARQAKEPQLNWLRDCGEIENLAHLVLHIALDEPLQKGQLMKDGKFSLVCNQKARNIDPFRIPIRRSGATYEVDTSRNASAEDIPSDF